MQISGKFIEGQIGKLFVTRWSKIYLKTSVFIIFQPFGDEQNRLRRFLSQFAQSVGEFNFDVIIVDMYGTGDSEGDLSDTNIDIWRSDITTFIDSLDYNSISILAIRFGSLLFFDLINRNLIKKNIDHIILCHPFYKKNIFWNQFARLKVAESLVTGKTITIKSIQDNLSSGFFVNISGYDISPDFFRSLNELNDTTNTLIKCKSILTIENTSAPQSSTTSCIFPFNLSESTRFTIHQLSIEPYWLSDQPIILSTLMDSINNYLREIINA